MDAKNTVWQWVSGDPPHGRGLDTPRILGACVQALLEQTEVGSAKLTAELSAAEALIRAKTAELEAAERQLAATREELGRATAALAERDSKV